MCGRNFRGLFFFQKPKELSVDLSEDCHFYISFKHLKYGLLHVLRFVHSCELGSSTRLWLSGEGSIHVRLEGKALSGSFVEDLFCLFPREEGLVLSDRELTISRLLVEAHGGRLLCNLYTLPSESYTEFVLELPLVVPTTTTKATR